MKKIFKSIVAIVLIISCLMALVSCSAPKLDVKQAKKNLEEEKYSVTFKQGGDADEGITAYLYAKKVTSDGTHSLLLIEFETTKYAKLYYQALRMEIENEMEENRLEIKMIEHILDQYRSQLSGSEIERYNETLDEIKEENEKLQEKLNCTGRSGKFVWQGDSAAIIASR